MNYNDTVELFKARSLWSQFWVNWIYGSFRDGIKNVPPNLTKVPIFSDAEDFSEIWKSQRPHVIVCFLIRLWCDCLRLFQITVLFSSVANALRDPSQSTGWMFIVIGVYCILGFLLLSSQHYEDVFWSLVSTKSEANIQNVFLTKLVKINESFTQGEILQRLNEIANVVDLVSGWIWLASGCIFLLGGLGFLFFFLSWTFAPALGVWGLFGLAQVLLGKTMQKFFRSGAIASERRASWVHKIMSGIRGVKFQGAESPAFDILKSYRKKETKAEIASYSVRMFSTVINNCFNDYPLFIVFSIYLIVFGRLSGNVFVALNIFGHCSNYFQNFSNGISKISRGNFSRDRLSTFFNAKGFEEFSLGLEICVKVENVSFAYASNEIFRNISISSSQGDMYLICGKSGSGKTTLLKLLSGLLQPTSGNIIISGSCAYVPQDEWFPDAPIRDCITFGSPFEIDKFERCSKLACLHQDFQSIGGEFFSLSENGSNLSSGQRQRLAIARALYSDAGVFFLDDALSALDAKIAKKVFFNLKAVLVGRISFFALHQEMFFPYFGKIIDLNNESFSLDIVDKVKIENIVKDEENNPKDEADNWTCSHDKGINSLVFPWSNRAVSFRVLKRLLQFIGFPIIFPFLATTVAFGSQLLSTYWLAWFLDGTLLISNTAWIVSYFAFISFTIAASYISDILGRIVSIRTATKLHNKAFEGVLSGNVFEIERLGMGQIVARLTSDVSTCDSGALIFSLSFLSVLMQFIQIIVVISLTAPISLLVIPPVAVSVILILRFYIPGRRLVIRLTKEISALEFQRIISSVVGKDVIHVFQKRVWAYMFLREINTISVWTIFVNNNQISWMKIRRDLMSQAALSVVYFVLAYSRTGLDSSSVVMLIYCSQLSSIVTQASSMFMMVQNFLPSMERLLTLIEISKEDYSQGISVSRSWPVLGSVEISRVSMKYGNFHPVILAGLSFSLKSGWHIGIIGRTGSGKSSIIYAIIRACLFDGEILVDNLSVKDINVSDLRASIAIASKDFFSLDSTLRKNMDVWGVYTNERICEILSQLNLLSFFPQGLESEVCSSSLSKGQEQLLSIGRVMVKRSRLFLIDEATSSMDKETETVVENLFAVYLKEVSTIHVAHRLSMILNSHKILFLENGKVVAFKSPSELQATSSKFVELLKNSEIEEISKTSDSRNCNICYCKFSKLNFRKTCWECKKLTCSFCCKGSLCISCLQFKYENREILSSEDIGYLFKCFVLSTPKLEDCKTCLKGTCCWTCDSCKLCYCSRCGMFLRWIIAKFMQYSSNFLCLKCFSTETSKILKRGEEEEHFQKEFLVEILQGKLYFREPYDVVGALGSCILCRNKTITSMCENCKSFICFSDCGKYVYTPAINSKRHSFICLGCIKVTTSLGEMLGDPPAFFLSFNRSSRKF